MSKDPKITLGSQAKVAAAKGAAASNIIAQITEVVVAIGAVWLLSIDKLDQQNFMIIAGACIIGPAVGHVRGKVAMSSTATVLALLPLAIQKNLVG